MWSSSLKKGCSDINLRLIAPTLLAVVVAGAGAARAADWSLTGSLNQSTTYNDNRSLSPTPTGGVLSLANAVSLNLAGKGPDALLGLSANLGYPLSFGPGVNEQSQRLHVGFGSNYQHQLPRDTFTLSASLVPESTTVTELTDSGEVNVDATRLSLRVSGSEAHTIDRLTSLTLSGSGTRVEFSGDAGDLKQYTSLSASAALSRRLTKRTAVNANFGWFSHNPDDPSLADSNTLSGTLGLSSAITRQLSFAASLGWRRTDRTDDVSTSGWVGNLSLSYKQKNTSYSLTAAENVAPSSLGAVQTTASIGANVSHKINDSSQALLSVSYSAFSSSAQPDRQQLVIAPSYSFQATRTVTGNLGYRFTRRTGGSGDASSNAFVFGFSHDLSIKP